MTRKVVAAIVLLYLLTPARPVAAAGPIMYIANSGNNTISMVDLAYSVNLGNLGGTVYGPTAIALDVANNKMYIANGDHISRANLDGSGGVNLGNLGGTLDNPQGIALDVANNKMYVTMGKDWAGEGTNSISRANLDGTGGVNLGNLGGTLNNPWGIALDVANNKMYVANHDNDTIVRANLDGAGGVSLGNLNGTLNRSAGIALDLGNNKMYVANIQGNAVSRANLDGTGGVSLGNLNDWAGLPTSIAIDVGNDRMYVTSLWNGSLAQAKLDGTGGVSMGNPEGWSDVEGIALDLVNRKMYVVDHSTSTVGRVNLAPPVSLGNLNNTLNQPAGIALDSAHNKMYVANNGNHTISRANLDGTSGGSLGNLNNTLNQPAGIALDVANNKMYVANNGNNTVSRADLNGTGGVSLGNLNNTLNQPTGIALDVANGKMYVANNGNHTISRANLDGTSGVSLGNLNSTLKGPTDIALDLVNNKMYVPNFFLIANGISRANLDGTGGTSLGDLNGTLEAPFGIALMVARGRMCVANYINNSITAANLDGTGGIVPGNLYRTATAPWGIALYDTTPAVARFTATSPSSSLNIPITAFSATDDIGVTGYMITTSSTPPAAGAPGWSSTAPTTYSVPSVGSYTLYPWAKDAAGTVSAVYGTPASVTVIGQPVVTTNAVSSITVGGATLNGTVNANNASTTVTFEYGLDTAYGNSVTAEQSPVTGMSSTAVSKAITGLTPNTLYHYRVVGSNVAGTTNGLDQTFTTLIPVPTLTNISPTSAAVNAPDFTLTVTGTNFVASSVVRWNGGNRATTFVSATKLTAAIARNDLSAAGTVNVTVFNPTPGGGTSNAASFTINPTTSTVMLTSSCNPCRLQQTVRITATVTNTVRAAGRTALRSRDAIPSGTMTFKNNGNNIAGCANLALNGAGQAICVTTLPSGTHMVTAQYSGDANFNPGAGTLSQSMNYLLRLPAIQKH